jgi:hypothetical protein
MLFSRFQKVDVIEKFVLAGTTATKDISKTGGKE